MKWLAGLLSMATLMAGGLKTELPKRVEEGATVLQFGTHPLTEWMLEHYTVVTVESNLEKVHAFPGDYVFAPISGGKYDADALRKFLPREYDAILLNNKEAIESLPLLERGCPIFVLSEEMAEGVRACL